jgi:hypothetical protein
VDLDPDAESISSIKLSQDALIYLVRVLKQGSENAAALQNMQMLTFR